MFGNNVGGEIIFASKPKDITAQGGGNEPISFSPGKKVNGDGPSSFGTIAGSSSSGSVSGDVN